MTLPKPRVLILTITSILLVIGIVMIFASSAILADKQFGDSYYFLKRQLVWCCVGIVALLIGVRTDYKVWEKYGKVLVIASIFLLILSLVPGVGKKAGGAWRWIAVGPFRFQPAEFVKFAFVGYMAGLLVRKRDDLNNFKKTLLPLLILFAWVFLILLKQPNLGTGLILGTLVFVMLFVGGLNWRYTIGTAILSILLVAGAIISSPYRMARISAFLRPWDFAQGTGYQIIHSLIALGSGGLFGKGLGASKEKLLYLPDPHTDFIFSIIGEELGFLGTFTIISLFVVFVWCGIKVSVSLKDPFGTLLGFGLTFMIGLQAAVNIGVATRVLPTAGLPLPFISYGGSSLVFTLLSVGVLLNLSKKAEKVKSPKIDSSF
jgi:cell division protein FtsW